MPAINSQRLLDVGIAHRVWRAPSTSRRGLFHYVMLIDDPDNPAMQKLICSCEGYSYHGRCWHIDEAQGKVDEGEVEVPGEY